MQDYRIPSDELATLRDLYNEGGAMAALGALFQIDLILDANVVIGELRWVTKHRVKPDARSALLEVMEAGTLKAWAPTFLESEVEKHIATLVDAGSSESEVAAHWQRLRPHINFVDVGGAPENGEDFLDPKDVPYLRLQKLIEAGILSKDHHINAMGGRAIHPFRILAALRAYSRASAVHVTIQVNGYRVGAFSLMAIAELIGLASRSLKRVVGAAPRHVLLVVVLLATVAMAIPDVRAWFRTQASKVFQSAAGTWDVLLELGQCFATEYQRIKSMSDEAHISVLELIEGGGHAEDEETGLPACAVRGRPGGTVG